MAVPAGVDTIELGYDIRALNRCAILIPFSNRELLTNR